MTRDGRARNAARNSKAKRGRSAMMQRILCLAAAGILGLTWPAPGFGQRPTVASARPYELDWAGRKADDHPPLVDFERLDGWRIEAESTGDFGDFGDRHSFPHELRRMNCHEGHCLPILSIAQIHVLPPLLLQSFLFTLRAVWHIQKFFSGLVAVEYVSFPFVPRRSRVIPHFTTRGSDHVAELHLGRGNCLHNPLAHPGPCGLCIWPRR